MSKIYIAIGNGQSLQYDEHEIPSMLRQGVMRDDALFWKEGMAGWEPLRNLFPASAAVSTPPAILQRLPQPEYQFTKAPFGLTKTLKVMLWVQLGASVISMLSDAAQMSLLASGQFTPEAVAANDTRQSVVAVFSLVVTFVTGIIFLKWIYRANLNCRGFGAVDMKYTPGWSIGYYFIPFLNLVRPYQVMKEIWKVSSDPKRWQTRQANPILGWWWALWLINGFLGQITFRMSMHANTAESLQAATAVSILFSLFEIPLILVAMKVISRIVEKQAKLTQPSGLQE